MKWIAYKIKGNEKKKHTLKPQLRKEDIDISQTPKAVCRQDEYQRSLHGTIVHNYPKTICLATKEGKRIFKKNTNTSHSIN